MKTNKGSRYFDGSKESNFRIVDWWWCGLIENVHRLFVVGDNVFELPVNALVIVTFKNENVENDIIENIELDELAEPDEDPAQILEVSQGFN